MVIHITPASVGINLVSLKDFVPTRYSHFPCIIIFFRVIQSRSSGNPGWIESFLVSMTQAGALEVRNAVKNQVLELGLVQPPITMMFRFTKETETKSDKEGFSESELLDTDEKEDSWEMYQHSYKVSKGKYQV